MQPEFYTDKDIARRLSFSQSWVRGQRAKREKGKPHFLDLEPHRFGSSVRYDIAEAEAFIAAIKQVRR